MGRRRRIVGGAAAALALVGCSGDEDRAAGAGTIGYSVQPPPGWEDITAAVGERTDAPFDVAFGGPTAAGVRATLNVTRRGAREGDSLRGLVRDGRAEVDELGGGRLDFTRANETSVAGEPALRYDFEVGAARIRQVGVLRGREYFVVTLTAAGAAFRGCVARLDGLLRSWSWD